MMINFLHCASWHIRQKVLVLPQPEQSHLSLESKFLFKEGFLRLKGSLLIAELARKTVAL